MRLDPRNASILFTAITFAVSWTFLWVAIERLHLPELAIILVLMWIPALVSIFLRVANREGFDDVGLRLGKPRFWLYAYGVPLAAATVTYSLAWLLGQVSITVYLRQQSMYGPLPFRLAWINANAGVLGFLAQRLVVVMTLGALIGFGFALGEEIGWRGYLLPRLVKANVRFPILVSGIIWGIWHVPFVLLTFQHQPYVTAVLYVFLCVVFAVFVGWLRLASGSVFVAAMAHAAYNTFYQDFFDHSFAGANKWFWAGEVGLLPGLAFGAIALWLGKSGRLGSVLQAARGVRTEF